MRPAGSPGGRTRELSRDNPAGSVVASRQSVGQGGVMRMGIWARTGVAALLTLAVGAAGAQAMVIPPEHYTPPAGATPAPELEPVPAEVPEGIVPWDTLAQIGIEYASAAPGQTEVEIVFGPAVEVLDGAEVTLAGFMYPLEVAERHDRFLLSPMPANCPFCLPAGPAQMVEVISSEALTHTFEPIVLAGRFEVLRRDPSGLYYRLSEAAAVPE
jgi:uncharacterized protein